MRLAVVCFLATLGMASACGGKSVTDGEGAEQDGGPPPDAATADAGAAPECVSPLDCPGVDADCFVRECDAGSCDTRMAPLGTSCGPQAGAGVCTETGECAQCNSASDCSVGELCAANTCVPATCSDAALNGNETDVDCGGDCGPCGNGLVCIGGKDCSSGYCNGGACAACATNADCEGPAWCAQGQCTALKALGQPCSDIAECEGGNCVDGVCCSLPSCGTDADCVVCNAVGFEGQCHLAKAGHVCGAGKCDGTGSCATGVCTWNKKSEGGATGYAGAAFPSGGVVVAGTMGPTLDFGCGSMAGAGNEDAYVAVLDSTGGCVWSKRAGDFLSQVVYSAAVDDAGNVGVGGGFDGVIDFGCGAMTSLSNGAGFVAMLDSTGACKWSKSYTAGNVSTVAFDHVGNLLVAGDFRQDFDLGCGAIGSFGSTSPFIAKLGSNGACLWTKHTTSAHIQSVAASGTDDVLLAGDTGGGSDFGCGQISAVSTSAFVAKLDAFGGCVWSKSLGKSAEQYARAVAADPSGNILVAGDFYDQLEAGCGVITAQKYADAFAVKLDPSGGCLWSRQFPGGLSEQGFGISSDSHGNVVVAGDSAKDIDLGCGKLDTGPAGAYVAKLDPSGDCLWSRAGKGLASVFNAGVDQSDNIYVIGQFVDSVDWGCASLTGGNMAAFVTKFTP